MNVALTLKNFPWAGMARAARIAGYPLKTILRMRRYYWRQFMTQDIEKENTIPDESPVPSRLVKEWSRNKDGDITEFELLPCPFCGSSATMRAYSYEEKSELGGKNVYIRCGGDECDISGPSIYISGKAEHDPMSKAAVQRGIDRWNRRQVSTAPTGLRDMPDEALLAELTRRLTQYARRPPPEAIGYVYPSRTPDGKLTLSLWSGGEPPSQQEQQTTKKGKR
jgi:hypothetical protein